MRIFLVAALVLAGAIGMVQTFEGDSFDADASSRDASAASMASGSTPARVAPESAPVVNDPSTTESTAPVTAAADTTTTPTAISVVDSTMLVSTLSPILSSFCPSGLHAAVVDRERQMAWLCESGMATYEFAFTGAITQPDPGTYPVYAKDMKASSSSSAGVSTMTHFVAFTYGKFRGARIAFHSMPTWSNGEWLQPLESVGDVDRRGESAGCLRVLPDDAVRVWDWLAKGDEVRVIN